MWCLELVQPQVVSATNSAFDYLVATFPVSHGAGSASAFQNLSLYALAKNGNIGGTAIKSITNFGGISGGSEQARIAKLLIPVHAVTNSSGNVVIDNSKADFQAFTSAEVTAATTAAGTAITANDTVLNYGFSARCVTACTANSRIIPITPTPGTGSISLAIRVPKAAAATTYGFTMNFLVMDESVARVTRGVYPSETVAQAESRGTGVSATRLMQFGLNRGTTSLSSDTVNDVNTSKLSASIHALGLTRISAGVLHSCGLNSLGVAYCWGSGVNGKLGNGTTTNSNVPVLVSGSLTFSSITTGDSHTCGLTLGGTAYCWGVNGTDGVLGNGGTANSNVPVLVSGGLTFSSITGGGIHNCGVTLAGAGYCWGYGGEGQLGKGNTTNSNVPAAVSGGLTFSSIYAGNFHTCGLTTAGAAYCWGWNIVSAIGNGTNTDSYVPTAVSGGLTFLQLTLGDYHTCGVTTAGTAYCWGDGANGRLGKGNTTSSNVPAAVSGGLTFSGIYAGSSQTCGLTRSGTAYCWGSGANGRLGNSTTTDTNVPGVVSGSYTFSTLGVNNSHGDHICGLTSSGIVYCWGKGADGRLGNNGTSDSTTPVAVTSSSYSL